MEDIYCLWSKPQKGVPIFINGVLTESYNKDNPMPPMDYLWTNAKFGDKVLFPKELWLISKEKLLLFDYYPAFDGFIVSNKFLSVLEKFTKKEFYQVVPLKTIGWKGKEITPKTYFYIYFNQSESLIDYKKSEYILAKNANIDYVMKMGFGIDKFKEITFLNTNIDTPFFILNDVNYSKHLFSNKAFKKEIEEANLYGFDIIHYKALPYAHNEKYKAYN